MKSFTFPCKSPSIMDSPYDGDNNRKKYRFYANVNDIPQSLLEWMSPNPREQDLDSPVAQTIARSLVEPHQEFHLRNRGIVFSAKEVSYKDDHVRIVMDDEAIHGDIDGGHTLKIIVSGKKPMPEKYVEFEIMTGLESVVDIAEARNTSAAIDMRSLEEAKNAFEVFKRLFADKTIGGDRFTDRIEWKQNQQLDNANSIDIRTIISLVLAFNQSLYPIDHDNVTFPSNLYGTKEAAMKRFLVLGETREERDAILVKMSPILMGLLTLWDTIEMEFGMLDKRYRQKRFVEKSGTAKALFSNRDMPYYVPQAITFPLVCAFRALVRVSETGEYGWSYAPIEAWQELKSTMSNSIMSELSTFKDTLSRVAKSKSIWRGLFLSVEVYTLKQQM